MNKVLATTQIGVTKAELRYSDFTHSFAIVVTLDDDDQDVTTTDNPKKAWLFWKQATESLLEMAEHMDYVEMTV